MRKRMLLVGCMKIYSISTFSTVSLEITCIHHNLKGDNHESFKSYHCGNPVICAS